MEEKKRCKMCGKEKPLSEFHVDNSKPDKHKSICKECLSVKKNKVSGIDKNIKQSIRYCLKYNGSFRWSKILNFSKEELKEHLASEFKEDMNFDNYGCVWGVTFHIPRRVYSFTKFWDNEFKKCWSLKNIKPDYIINCKRQKAEISENEVDEFGLWDILPNGNISKYFTNGKFYNKYLTEKNK